MFTPVSEVYGRNTRSAINIDLLVHPSRNTEVYSQGFAFSGDIAQNNFDP